MSAPSQANQMQVGQSVNQGLSPVNFSVESLLCSVLNGEESVDSIHFGSTIPGALEVQSFSLIDKIILVSKFMLTYFLGCFWQFCYTAFHGK